MNLFVVLFRTGIPPSVLHLARAAFADQGMYKVSDKALLVRTTSSDPASVILALGITSEADNPVVGVVLKLNGTYQGYDTQDLWDWFVSAGVGT